MPQPSEPNPDLEALRAKLIGLGERSHRKSYYPQLQKQLQTIGEMNQTLEQRIAERTADLVASNAALEEQIAERERAEASLRQTMDELHAFHAIVNRSPAVVFLWRIPEGPLEFISSNVRQFGYTPEELTSDRDAWRKLLPPDRAKPPLDEFGLLVTAGEHEFLLEFQVRTKGGEDRWVEDYGLVLAEADGIPRRIQGVLLDVTERKRAADHLQQLNQALEQYTGQLRALACQLAEAEERVRRHLAQALHDNVQQLLVAAKLRLSRQAHQRLDEPLRRSLQEAMALLDQALSESRELTGELSPPILYDAGLAAGLEWLARQIQERHGVRVQLALEPAAAAAAGELTVFLFQVIRELLLNVTKHAQAEVADVSLQLLPEDRIVVTVADQGVGFDPAVRLSQGGSSGLGLFGLRERLSFLGGSLGIDAQLGAGTRIRIELPIPSAAKRPPTASRNASPSPPLGFRQ